MPYRLPTPCRNRSCPNLTADRDGFCPDHKQQRFTGYERKPAAYRKLYSTAAWQRVRLAVLFEQPLCTLCLREGRTTPATDVHHLQDVKVRPDLALDPANLQPICHSHHSTITLQGLRDSQRDPKKSMDGTETGTVSD